MKTYKKNLNAKKAQDILRATPGDLCIVSEDFDLIWWNQEPSPLFEFPIKCHEALFQQKRPCPECPLRHPKDLKDRPSSIISIDGLKDTFLVHVASLPSSMGEYVVVHQKITSLAKEWTHLETIHSALPLGILLTDRDLKIKYANRGLFELFPFLDEPLSGSDLRLVVSRHIPPFPKRLLDFLFRLSNSKRSSDSFELSFSIPKHIEIQSISHKNPSNPTMSGEFIFLFLDRTKEDVQKLLERQQQAYSTMTSFVSSLFRALEPSLKRIQDLSDVEAHRGTPSALTNLHQEASQLLGKLESLQRFIGQKTEKKWGRINLNDVLQRVIKRLKPLLSKENIKLKTRFTYHLKPIQGPRLQMQQCIWDILSNAVEGVKLKIGNAGGPFIPRIEILTHMVGSVLELTIKDNGVGMDADQLAKACHPAYTTKDPSYHAGMGLFLCETLLHHMGGTLELSSVQGVGTKVVMRIPATPSLMDEVENVAATLPPPSKKRRKPKKEIFSDWRVWLLGEEDTTAEVIRKFLLKLGATIEGMYDLPSFQKMETFWDERSIYVLNITDTKQVIPFLATLGEKHCLKKTLILAPEEVLPRLKGRLKNTDVQLLKKPFPMESLVESLTSIMGAER